MSGYSRALIAVVAVAGIAAVYVAGYARVVPLPHVVTNTDRSSSPLYRSRLDFFLHPTTQPNWCSFGDSITQFGEWSELFPEYRTANRGIAGDNTRTLSDRLAALGDLSRSTVVLMIGINDVLAFEAATPEIIDRYEAVLKDLMSRARTVVVQSILPVAAPQNIEINGSVTALNEATKRFCQDKLHLSGSCRAQNCQWCAAADVTFDGLHLNGTGYLEWAGALRSHLKIRQGG